MNKYAIFCTECQTRKALELGAPIDNKEAPYFQMGCLCYRTEMIPPTAEEMIGWLEEQGIMFNIDINPFGEYKVVMSQASRYYDIANMKWKKSRKEATLAAIDKALEYLENRRNNK